MQVRILLGLSAAVLLAGCSSTSQLSAAGQAVAFTDTKPGSECQLLGQASGSQSNWLAGNHSDGSSMRSAANDLRNKAAAMGGNTIYGTTSSSETFWSSFAPLDSKMNGSVYKCP
ncbi:DUF4156 domain-containing protein [Pectobacterium versatile]|uniref:DUF4156 domain-containing protein n=3 Tax=Pectobacterium TaxID=122277 RepID=A0AAP9LCN5_9GAMM|nr:MULTISPECIES: DUF4156 domain-containing protein [Pectobacterium]ASN83948.1 Uncharacterized protein YjeI [Pectobacterium versatile]ASY74856.1 hypothetical protein BJJ97_02490 [Pectobacterium polaris]AVT60494.1 putative lipoprotein [Pectobacterium versatile]AZK64376.1 DUF4156 domain-containing protein [Pectobacterium versatile]KFX10758.1 membrane protein [Pectobacterium parvum]